MALGVPPAILVLRGDEEPPAAADSLDACRGVLGDAARECLIRAFGDAVADRDDPRPALTRIEQAVRAEGGFALANCHGVMHTVGRTYATEREATLADLKDYLPRSNDPGCSAGFAHGLVTGAAPSLDPRRPREAAEVCDDASTRYQRYSCVHGLGHAFMRIHGDRLPPALDLCRALGVKAAADCAQGAYHDYWFAVVGVDDARLPGAAVTEPRELCGSQPVEFVRPCWYRAFVDNRPAGIVVDSPEHLDVLCDGLEGLQRTSCITAASVIGPADPEEQLAICAQLTVNDEEVACVRGAKVQNLLGAPEDEFVRLIEGCRQFTDSHPRRACYSWLGKVITVVTDGAFARTGCAKLDEGRRECAVGARSADDALETFS